MAAPSGIVWGSKVGDYGRIGIYKSITSTNTQSTLTVEVWIGTKYSVSDTNNTLYFDDRASSGSATTDRGSKSINTTVASGTGWSDSNERKLYTYTKTYDRGASDVTRYLCAKLANVDRVGGTMYVSTTATIPKLATYTVTYNANGGSGAPGTQTKTYGKALTLSTVKPTRTGYTFQKWNTKSDGTGTNYNPGASYTTNANITLYAIWKANNTVTYNANGGSGAPGAQTKTYGKALTLSSTEPTRTGYTFQKWNTKSDGTGTNYNPGASYTTNANITLYAIWKANAYTVTYNANGGSGAPGAQTKTYGKALTLSSTEPTRTDYKFLGWSASKTATTATYKAGGAYTANNAITLYAVWELAYVKPTIKNLTVSRHVSHGGDQSDSGTWARVRFSWTTFNKTPLTITVKIGSDTYSVTGFSATSGDVDTYFDASLDPDTTYSVTVMVNDGTETVSVNKNLTGAKYVIDLLKGGNGAAFGKSAELDGYLDNNFKLRQRNNIAIENAKGVFAYDPEGNQVEVMYPMNANGNTSIGYGNFHRTLPSTDGAITPSDTNACNTSIYGYDIIFGASSTGSKDTYRPYRRKGDSFSVSIQTAGFVTNAGKDVHFTVPLAEPVIGSPKVSITSGGGFMLRQGAQYTHGSSATVSIHPVSYAADVSYLTGVHIKATFEDLANVTNNDAIGIYWNGTITFT